MQEKVRKQYEQWKSHGLEDEDLVRELDIISKNEDKISDAFYRDLEFGTGGLRGVIGVGTNRMNIYTVAKASQGLANYICKKYSDTDRRIAISYDSRIKSKLFAETAAGVFAANGIRVYIFKELMPTPCLSYAVRKLNCASGIMVTASHNPAKYNGYKVYGDDGCQITTEAANQIYEEIQKLDIFKDIKKINYENASQDGKISYIGEEVYTEFIEEVKKQTMLDSSDDIDKSMKIVYTPLNGAGLKPVLRVLEESGYCNVVTVKEQEEPDGNFPTCPYPNPEIEEAMQLGIHTAQRENADLSLATDPDCDRVGTAVRDVEGNYILISGNEMGLLLLDYICSMRKQKNKMPKHPVLIKTIVTTDLAEKVAKSYGVDVINVLTGFKFIGEQIGLLEKEGRKEDYIFGFEESYGYLSGSYVRDKDAVNGAFLICEMFAYYKTRGISLLDKLEELYRTFGYCLNSLSSYEFEGSDGFAKMQCIMEQLRGQKTQMWGEKVEMLFDYSKGVDNLPKSNVLKFKLESGTTIVVRPSGTEALIRVMVEAKKAADADSVSERLVNLIKML